MGRAAYLERAGGPYYIKAARDMADRIKQIPGPKLIDQNSAHDRLFGIRRGTFGHLLRLRYHVRVRLRQCDVTSGVGHFFYRHCERHSTSAPTF